MGFGANTRTLLRNVTYRTKRSKIVFEASNCFGGAGGFGGERDRCTEVPVAKRAAILNRGPIDPELGGSESGISLNILWSSRDGTVEVRVAEEEKGGKKRSFTIPRALYIYCVTRRKVREAEVENRDWKCVFA